jgi:acyl-coenzyme A synthetase/AMP-(fatty) acid ligase
VKLPLLAPVPADTPLFLLRGQVITHAQFGHAALELAARLPERPAALNLCEDRYCFALAFAALALRGQQALLPPSGHPAALEAVRAHHPRAYAIGDDPACAVEQILSRTPSAHALGPRASLPALAADQCVAVVHTSGTTGAPQPIRKPWHALHHAGRALAHRLLQGYGRCHIVATVPPQHMYGLEASVLLALVGGHCAHRGRPVYPPDVRAALEELPAPRVLVTTPVHVRALLATATRLPELACLISATAPLPSELAQRAENAFAAPVYEIYGCSEAGSLATRRTLAGQPWQPLPGVTLEYRADTCLAHGVHLLQPVLLQDVLEPSAGGFHLLGRAADMVKVAGKRASLAELTQKLLSIPGVIDGIVFQPHAENAPEDVLSRPAALVVAPRLSEREIRAALGRLVDPVFLPRPLRKVERLPRNEVGKLARAALRELL